MTVAPLRSAVLVAILATCSCAGLSLGIPAGEMEYSAYADVYVKAGPGSLLKNARRLKRLYVPAFSLVGNDGGPEAGAFIVDNYYYGPEWHKASHQVESMGSTTIIPVLVNDVIVGYGEPDRGALEKLLLDPQWGLRARNALLSMVKYGGYKAVACELKGTWEDLKPAYTAWFQQLVKDGHRQGIRVLVVLIPPCDTCRLTPVLAQIQDPMGLAKFADGILLQPHHFPKPVGGLDPAQGSYLMAPAPGEDPSSTFFAGQLEYARTHLPLARTEFSIELGGSAWTRDAQGRRRSAWLDWATWIRDGDKAGVLRRPDGSLFRSDENGVYVYNDAKANLDRLRALHAQGLHKACLMSPGLEEPALWDALH